jgi:hypothetical protein
MTWTPKGHWRYSTIILDLSTRHRQLSWSSLRKFLCCSLTSGWIQKGGSNEKMDMIIKRTAVHIIYRRTLHESRNSSFCIVTGYELDGRGWIPDRSKWLFIVFKHPFAFNTIHTHFIQSLMQPYNCELFSLYCSTTCFGHIGPSSVVLLAKTVPPQLVYKILFVYKMFFTYV